MGLYVGIGTNDPLVKLVDDFQQRWRESKRTLTAGEVTAVTDAITAILQA